MKSPRRDDGEMQRVQAALERFIRRDQKYRALSRAVRDAQRELRRCVGDDGWELYLALEERMNARHVEVILAAVQIAMTRAPKRRRETRKTKGMK